MGSRFISAVAFYGPKTGPLREALAEVQALITEHIGEDFRPYSLEQVHATLIALDAARDPGTGAIVNAYLLAHAGVRREMDLPRVMDILARAAPLRVRIGGFRPDQEIPFTSQGQHLAERTFSVQDKAFVLMGWPAASLTGAGRPLDELRREMNEANVRHKYHVHATDVDNDLYLVVGHHAGAPRRRARAGHRRGPGQAGRRPGGPGHRPDRRQDRRGRLSYLGAAAVRRRHPGRRGLPARAHVVSRAGRGARRMRGVSRSRPEAAKMAWTIQSASRTPRAVPRAPASRAPSGIMP